MSRFRFDIIKTEFSQLKRELPVLIGNDAQRFFVDSFKKQGWTDGGFQKWKTPQRRIPGTPAYKYPKNKDKGRKTRATLIGKSGGTKQGAHAHLRQSVNNSVKKASWDQILFSVPQPYAKRHNDGLKGMPKRKFMGNSKELTSKMALRMHKKITKIFKP